MADNYGLEALYKRPNPHDRTAKVAGAMLPNSGLAAPGMAYVMGKETAAAGQFDNQQYQDAQGLIADQKATDAKTAQAKTFMDTFQALLKEDRTRGDAVMLWNEQAGNLLGIDHKISTAIDNPEMLSVKLENGGWWGIDKSTGKPNLWDGEKKVWREATEKDMATLQGGEPPKTRERQAGRDKITEEWNPAKKTWVKVSQGPMDAPDTGEGGVPKEYRQWYGDASSEALKRALGNSPDKQVQLVAALSSSDPGAAMDAISRSMTPEQVKVYEDARDQYMRTNTPDSIRAQYLKIRGRQPTIGAPPALSMGQMKSPGATGAPGAAPPQAAGKTLDQATAMQILQEAGGDKNKAREIAKAKGFSF